MWSSALKRQELSNLLANCYVIDAPTFHRGHSSRPGVGEIIWGVGGVGERLWRREGVGIERWLEGFLARHTIYICADVDDICQTSAPSCDLTRQPTYQLLGFTGNWPHLVVIWHKMGWCDEENKATGVSVGL